MGRFWSLEHCAWVEWDPRPDPLATPWSWAPPPWAVVCPLTLEDVPRRGPAPLQVPEQVVREERAPAGQGV